jgi:hypothetical protein
MQVWFIFVLVFGLPLRVRNEFSDNDLEELTCWLVCWQVEVRMYTDSHSYRQVNDSSAPAPRTPKEGAVE